MEQRVTKAMQFAMALERTKEAVAAYGLAQNDVMRNTVRDGVIQRFEFTCELAWKACREFLLAEGFVGFDSPKSVMRQAYACGLVEDEAGWLSLLQARNLTSHVYSEAQAQEIYEEIEKTYLALFDALREKLVVSC